MMMIGFYLRWYILNVLVATFPVLFIEKWLYNAPVLVAMFVI